MEGSFVPNGAGAMRPFWRNFFENQATVQFDHRIGAYLILAAVVSIYIWAAARSEASVRRALNLMLAGVIVQVLLGIWTLLAVVPVALGLLHQTGALVLFAATINLAHAATLAQRKPQAAHRNATSSQAETTRSLGIGP
jgi:heme a synthase